MSESPNWSRIVAAKVPRLLQFLQKKLSCSGARTLRLVPQNRFALQPSTVCINKRLNLTLILFIRPNINADFF